MGNLMKYMLGDAERIEECDVVVLHQ